MPSQSPALPGGLQQRSRIGHVDAEFGGETQLGIFGRNTQPHAEAQITRRLARFVCGRRDDLLQLVLRIEAEGAHAVLEIRFADRARGLDRVHETLRGLRKHLAHQPHLGDRGDVVMRHAALPQHSQQVGRRIRLYCVERLSGELLHEEARSAGRGVGAIQDDRLVGREGANYGSSVEVLVQFKGPPNGKLTKAALRFRVVPMGQREGAYRARKPNRKGNLDIVKLPFPINRRGTVPFRSPRPFAAPFLRFVARHTPVRGGWKGVPNLHDSGRALVHVRHRRGGGACR